MKNRYAAYLSLLLMPALSAMAERNHLTPADFEPLTSLPWARADATLEGVLNTIFREPNSMVRYPVLAEYLRIIPVGQIARAFDLCIELEDTEVPNALVEFFLPIWAKRDPKACWRRTKELFRVVGIDNGWLGYDNWTERPRLTVQDPAAIRASRFYLQRDALLSFPGGLGESSLPRAERVRMMKEFAETWFAAFGTWPGYPRPRGQYNPSGGYPDRGDQIVQMLKWPADPSMTTRVGSGDDHDALLIVALRRLLLANPASAPALLDEANGKKGPPSATPVDHRANGPTVELFLIWEMADLPGMVRWTESLDLGKDDYALEARGFLMSRVAEETRERWLAEAKLNAENLEGLFENWACWDPQAAFVAAVAMGNADAIEGIATEATYWLWCNQPANTSHHGLAAIRDFDLESLPHDLRQEVITRWCNSIVSVMEQWGDIDVGEAARYGFHFLERTDYRPREYFVRLFSGDDRYASDSDMIDRTFCALRTWAVFKPDEMKAWIATQKDADMRKALTWLLQHPWGTGPKE